MKSEHRELVREEIDKLSIRIQKLEREINKGLNKPLILALSLVTILSAIHIYYYDRSNWSLPSKCLVCFCPIFIWVLVEEKYKGRNKLIQTLNALKAIQLSQVVQVIPVRAKRVIKFEDLKDEGNLYLIENEEGQCLYLWDEQWLIPEGGQFPCDTFEVYQDERFKYALEEKVKCSGEKIKEIIVPGEEKWKYFELRGFPEDFEIEQKSLDEIMKEINKDIA